MTLLAIENASYAYDRRRPVLHDASLTVGQGEAVGLVGESGSGKTTLLRLALGLATPTSGAVRFDGDVLDTADRKRMRRFRRSVQAVFQDPYASLDPRQRVGAIVAEPLRSLRIEGYHGMMVAHALEAVGLDRDVVSRFPHQFSGGQRQRIAIARAIVCSPRLLLADEALSALDLTTRIRILDLLAELRLRMAILFVSHDIGAVAALCGRVVILERGRVVEAGGTASVLAHPSHPYTQRLLASVPRLGRISAMSETVSRAEEDFRAWREQRLAALAAPDGWLNIIGRYPLEDGTVRIGSAAGNDIVLPAGPADVGTLTQDEAGVLFRPADGGPEQRLVLSTYAPPRFTSGNLLLEVTTLNGENALRVRDTTPLTADRLPTLETFPFDPTWQITARWEALETPRALEIDTSRSIRTSVEAKHRAVFERDGRQFELLATHGTAERPQFVFRDATAATGETYPAARFLFGEAVTDTTIRLDFNRAINPPCAFTDFAVCPLPPLGNVLPIRVEAGERAPSPH